MMLQPEQAHLSESNFTFGQNFGLIAQKRILCNLRL